MKAQVMVYDIEGDKKTTREFANKELAEDYALNLKRVLLDRPNPAPVHIEVLPG